MFRKEIGNFINRVQKGSAGPVSFDLAEQQQKQIPDVQSIAEVQTNAIQTDLRPGNVTLATVRPETARLFQQPIPSDRQSQLARYWVVVALFERYYRVIFGQQLALLRAANAQPVGADAARRFFEESRKRGNTNQTFEQFLSFLINSVLLVRKDDTFQTTDVGRQFLTFLSAEGYSEDRPF
jgi:hypothetical protein